MALFALWHEDARVPAAIGALLREAAHVEAGAPVEREIATERGSWRLFAIPTATRFLATDAQIAIDADGGLCVVHGLIWRPRGARAEPLDAAAVAALLARPGDRLPADVAGEYAVARLHRSGAWSAFGDPAGLHQLFHADGRALVANRASFVAALAGSSEPDAEAATWITTIGYRVGQATAWRGVRQLAAGSAIEDGRVRALPDRIAVPAGPRGFAHGGDALLADGIAQAQASLSLACGDGPLDLPITGGKDSRAVLALCLAAGLRDRLTLFTRGYPDHPDVRVGVAIAATLGLPHRREPPHGADVPPDWPLARFHEEIARLAFQTDGNIGGWDLISGHALGAETLVTGHMGELLKAYAKRSFDPGDPAAIVAAQAPFDPLGLLRPKARAALIGTLTEQFAAERAEGAQEADLPDLFYLRNRIPNWLGGIRGIKSFERQPVLPLGVPAFTKLAMLMTAAERRAELAHYRLVRDLAPELVALPFAHQRWDEALPDAPDVPPLLAPAGAPLFGNWQYSINSRPEIRAHLVDLFGSSDLALWQAIDRNAVIGRLRDHRFGYLDGISLLGLVVSVYHGAGLLLRDRLGAAMPAPDETVAVTDGPLAVAR